MSLASDRARVIAASIRRDGVTRRVFVTPPETFIGCRVVAITSGTLGFTPWLRNQGAREAGLFSTGDPAEIERAVWKVWPRSTGNTMQRNPLNQSKHQ